MPLNIDLQQIFLHLLNFTLLFAIMYYLMYKPVKEFMAKRENYYIQMNETAEAALKKAQEDEVTYAQLLKGAEEEIEIMKDKARKEAEDYYNNKMCQAQDDASKMVMEARQKAEREKEKILTSAQSEISEMITAATEKIVLKSSASDAFDQFLDAAEGGDDSDSRIN